MHFNDFPAENEFDFCRYSLEVTIMLVFLQVHFLIAYCILVFSIFKFFMPFQGKKIMKYTFARRKELDNNSNTTCFSFILLVP